MVRAALFHVEIPCGEVTATGLPRLSDDAQQQTMPEGGSDGLSILLADDAKENCIVFKAFFKNTPHRLTIVEDGIQALEQFKDGDFDLVLMDIQMPGMNGYEVTEKIRVWERIHNLTPTPVLALTADAMKEDIEKTSTGWL